MSASPVHPSTLAPHELSFSSDSEIFHIVARGTLSGEHMATILASLAEYRDNHPNAPLFLLVDLQKATGIAPEARLAVANRAKQRPGVMFMAFSGGSLTVRTVVGLLVKAVGVASKTYRLSTIMASSESEARAWLDEHRRRYAAGQT